MSIGLKKNAAPEASVTEITETKETRRSIRLKKDRPPEKRTMNLYYKPDRTTKPTTIALYTIFVLVCLLGVGKFLVYDIWMETREAQQTLAAKQDELNTCLLKLANYNEVKERYSRYSATDEERALLDRMEILALLDSCVGSTATMDAIAISSNAVQIQFSGVTLGQTAEIVRRLEASPIVASITVSTAATTDYDGPPNDISAPVRANAMIQLQKEVAE